MPHPHCILRIRPSIDDPPQLAFAALCDFRIKELEYYQQFEPFLPHGFRIVGAPTRSDCLGYVMGIDRIIKLETFFRVLGALDLKSVGTDFIAGDLVLYYKNKSEATPCHAAIACDSVLVKGRIGVGNPIIEHPVSAVRSIYMADGGNYCAFRRPYGKTFPLSPEEYETICPSCVPVDEYFNTSPEAD